MCRKRYRKSNTLMAKAAMLAPTGSVFRARMTSAARATACPLTVGVLAWESFFAAVSVQDMDTAVKDKEAKRSKDKP